MCSERFCVLITAGLAVAQIPCKTVAHSFRTSVACYPLHHRPLLPFINTVIDFERHVGVRHAPSQAKPPRALAARRRQDRLALSRTCACPDPGRHAGHDASEPLFAIANMMTRSRAWNARSNPAGLRLGGRKELEVVIEKKKRRMCRSVGREFQPAPTSIADTRPRPLNLLSTSQLPRDTSPQTGRNTIVTMASLGDKIKEVFSGHHHDDTKHVDESPSHNAHEHNKLTKEAPGDGASQHIARRSSNTDSAIGGVDPRSPTTTTHHQPGHHADPETEAKEATSAAGNYPYWGNLPREQEREANPDNTTGGLHRSDEVHNSPVERDHSGLDKGALGTGAAAAGVGYLGREHYKKEPKDNMSAHTATNSSARAPAAPAAASFRQDLPDRTTAKPTATDNASTTAQVDPSEYPPKYDQGHGSRNHVLTGTGLAGAVGAGYLAHKNHQDHAREKESEKGKPTATATPAASTSSQKFPSAVDQQRHTADPVATKAQQQAAPDEYHDHKREEALAGAGYLASRDRMSSEHNARQGGGDGIVPGSSQRETTVGTFADRPTTGGGIHNTVVGAGSPEDRNTRRFPLVDNNNATTIGPQHGPGVGQQDVARADLGAPTSHHDRDRQALAAGAGVGASAGLVGAEKEHRHDKDEMTAYQAAPAATTSQQTSPAIHAPTQSQPAASQAAAQQAWRKQDSTTAGVEHGQYDQDKDDHHDHDRLKHGAAGVDALAGAGATAAYYGQGKPHDQNPRSSQSEKIVDGRMPGSYPQDTNAGGYSGEKVLHKCHQCGADNDITEYIREKASFGMGL